MKDKCLKRFCIVAWFFISFIEKMYWYIFRNVQKQKLLKCGTGVHIGRYCCLTGNTIVIGDDVYIEDDVWIGGGVILLKGVRIGCGSVIGAGSVITRNVAPYTIIAGCKQQKCRSRWNSDVIAIHEEKILKDSKGI